MSDLRSNPFAELPSADLSRDSAPHEGSSALETDADAARQHVQEAQPGQSVDLTHEPSPREVTSALDAVAETARQHVQEITTAYLDGLDPARSIGTRMRAADRLLNAEAQVARIRLGAHAVANDQARLEAMSKQELVHEITVDLAAARSAGIPIPENVKLMLAKAELTAALAGDVEEAEVVE